MSLGIFAQIYEGMLGAFGSPWLVMAFLAIGVISLISVLVKVNAFVSIFLAAVPFLILMLYTGIAGNGVVLSLVVVTIGILFATSLYMIFNR